MLLKRPLFWFKQNGSTLWVIYHVTWKAYGCELMKQTDILDLMELGLMDFRNSNLAVSKKFASDAKWHWAKLSEVKKLYTTYLKDMVIF
jgi:hypothetical protein